MILVRIPRASARRSAAAPAVPDAGRVRPVSPLGPALVVALGGVAFSAARRMAARRRRREDAVAAAPTARS